MCITEYSSVQSAKGCHQSLRRALDNYGKEEIAMVCTSGLLRKILQGAVPRKKGRQHKRWEDNVKEWAGLDVTQTAAEDRQRCKRLSPMSAAVPPQPWWFRSTGNINLSFNLARFAHCICLLCKLHARVLDWEKTEAQQAQETLLLDELVMIVDKRNELVQDLDSQERA